MSTIKDRAKAILQRIRAYYPYQKYEFFVSLPLEQVLDRFAEATEPKHKFDFFSKRKMFRGEFNGTELDLQCVRPRFIDRSAIAFVRIRVSLSDTIRECRIQVLLTMHTEGAMILFFWIGFVFLIVFIIVVGHLERIENGLHFTLAVLSVLVMGVVNVGMWFWSGAARVRQKIRDLFADAGYRELNAD